jgi:hypothetical protein
MERAKISVEASVSLFMARHEALREIDRNLVARSQEVLAQSREVLKEANATLDRLSAFPGAGKDY